MKNKRWLGQYADTFFRNAEVIKLASALLLLIAISVFLILKAQSMGGI